MKKQFRVMAVLFAALLLVGALFAGCQTLSAKTPLQKAEEDPAKFLMEALVKTGDTLQVKLPDQLKKLTDSIQEKGTVSFSGEVPMVGQVSGGVAYNIKDTKMYAHVDIPVGAESLSFEVFESDKAVCINPPESLLSSAYGMRIDNLKEDLKNASVWELMGIDYSEIQDMLESKVDQLEQLQKQPGKPDENSPVILRYKKMVDDMKAILAECKAEVKESTIGTGENAPASVLVTYTLTQEQYEKLSALYIKYVDETLKEAMEDIEDIASADLSLEDLEQMFKGLAGEYTVSFNVGNETGMVSQVTVAGDFLAEGKPVNLTVSMDFGADPAASKEWKFEIKTHGGDAEDQTVHGTVAINDGDGTFDRTLSMTDGSETVSVRVNVGNGKYSVTLNAPDSAVAISGTYDLTEAKLSVALATVAVDDTIENVDFTLTLEAKDTMPQMPEFKDILNLSMEDLSEIMNAIGGFGPVIPDEPSDDEISYVLNLTTDDGNVLYSGTQTATSTDFTDILYDDLADYDEDDYIVSLLGISPDYAWFDISIYVNDRNVDDSWYDLQIHDGDVIKLVFLQDTTYIVDEYKYNLVVEATNYETMKASFPSIYGYLGDELYRNMEFDDEGYILSMYGFAPNYSWTYEVYLNGVLAEDDSLELKDGDTITIKITPYKGA